MKRTELILVIIWIAFLLLKGVDYAGGAGFFILATFALSVYYLVGAFKIFEPKDNSPLIIPILAGVALATSLITIPFSIYLRNWDWLQILPFINIVFTSFLVGLIGLRLIRKAKIESNLKSILLRIAIVFVITCFFAFRLTGNSFYRNTIIFLNAGNDDLISNMRAFDLGERTAEQLEIGNCDKAIELALQSFSEGLNWLWIDEDSLTEKDVNRLWKIQATYTNVYRAYDCKAEKLYDSKIYRGALHYQLKADSFLNINPTAKNDWWRNERADSKNKVGLCYDRLYMHDSAASYFTKAIQYHVDSIRELNTSLSTYLNNLASSLSDGRYWNESNQSAKQSILVLDKDSISDDKSDNYVRSYLLLVYNAIAENKLSQAKEYLTLVEQYLNPERECEYHMYKSILANKLDNPTQTLYHAGEAKDCFIEHFGDQYQNLAESYTILYNAWISIPNYDSALANIQKGKEITRTNYGSQSIRFHDYVKREGYYHYYVGNYSEALNKLLDVKKVYERDLGNDSDKLPELFATIGRIKIEQLSFDEAEKYAMESLRLAKLHEFFIDERASGLLNDIAYIFYATNQDFVADTLYQKSIELNIKAERDSSLSMAGALNGLGLLSMKKSQLSKADTLFTRSLQLYQHRYPDMHPEVGIVLMNKSELQFKRKTNVNALELINQALENFTPYHRDNHPTIGDMYSRKAAILIMNDQQTEAQELLTKALEIYELNFQPDHGKIKEVRDILGAIDN